MSDSDDTDLLLLIPPDFFVVNSSDSEDSLPSSRKNHAHSRVDELISQVNELEERVNVIESKDNFTSDKSLSESSRFNHSLDYSLSLDSTKYNVGRQDLALRFYSMSSTGFRFDNRNGDGMDTQCTGPHMSNLSSKTDNCPIVSSLSRGDTGSDFSSVKCCHNANLSSTKYSTKVQPVEMNYSKGSNHIKFMTVEDLGAPSRISQQQQWKDCSFLSEIDEFLENKSRQSLEQVDALPCEVDNQDKATKYEDRREETSHKMTPAESILYNSSQNFDLEHVDKLLQQMEATHQEIERRLQSREHNTVQEISCKSPEQLPEQIGSRKLASTNKDNVNLDEIKSRQDDGLDSLQNELNSNGRDIPGASGYPYVQTFTTVNQTPYALSLQNCDSANKFQEEKVARLLERAGLNLEGVTDAPKEHDKLFENNMSKSLFTKSSDYCGDWFNKLPQPSLLSNNACPTGSGDGKSTNEPSENYLQTLRSKETKTIHSQSADSINVGRSKGLIHTTNLMKTPQNVQPLNDQAFIYSETENSVPDRSLVEPHNDLTSKSSRIPGAGISSSSVFDSGIKELHQNIYHQARQKDFIYEVPLNKDTNTIRSQELGQCNGGEKYSEDLLAKKRVEFTSDTAGNLPEVLSKPSVRVPGMDDGYFSSTGAGSSNTNLLSLSELWGSQPRITNGRENMTLEQKVEEERYRRKHCENLIQKLQSKLLEEQQKLAVAVKVDQAKDKAINQLQSAWKRLSLHWQELEDQRNLLSIQFSEEKEKHQQDLTEISQKVKRYEIELSKILDLAQGYKEKADATEQTMRDMESKHASQLQSAEEKLQEAHNRLVEAGQDVGNMRREMESIKDLLRAAEEKTKEEHNLLLKSQQETKKLKNELYKSEADMAALKEENGSLHLRLKEEKSRNSILEQNKKNAQAALEESKKKEKALREELKERAAQVERAKGELRDYYQQQVEQVVREKLAEFQAQLDAAEAALQHEAQQKEQAALDAAATQIQNLTDKNQLEVKLLEEKHREELQLYKLQLAQATHQIGQMYEQLQSYSNRKVEIVEKLHTVMETQWQEALRIISGNSPIVHPTEQQTRLREENATSAPSMGAVPVREMRGGDCVPPLHIAQSSGSSSTADELPFSREGQLTYRLNHEAQCNKVNSAPEKDSNFLQKYIEMLLNRPPGAPIGDDTPDDKHSPCGETPVSDRKSAHKWEHIMRGRQLNLSCVSTDTAKSSISSSKDPPQLSKPPWK